LQLAGISECPCLGRITGTIIDSNVQKAIRYLGKVFKKFSKHVEKSNRVEQESQNSPILLGKAWDSSTAKKCTLFYM